MSRRARAFRALLSGSSVRNARSSFSSESRGYCTTKTARESRRRRMRGGVGTARESVAESAGKRGRRRGKKWQKKRESAAKKRGRKRCTAHAERELMEIVKTE
eukprot:6198944-Pleurochrysis_carterae.AAC.6